MKGQWFLISAVIASGVFLFISGLFREYFVSDPSYLASSKEDFYFHNIKSQIGNIEMQPTCTDVEKSLRNFKAFTRDEMASFGYLLFLDYTYDCIARTVTPGILLASENMILCSNVDINDILPDNLINLLCR